MAGPSSRIRASMEDPRAHFPSFSSTLLTATNKMARWPCPSFYEVVCAENNYKSMVFGEWKRIEQHDAPPVFVFEYCTLTRLPRMSDHSKAPVAVNPAFEYRRRNSRDKDAATATVAATKLPAATSYASGSRYHSVPTQKKNKQIRLRKSLKNLLTIKNKAESTDPSILASTRAQAFDPLRTIRPY